MACNQSRKNAGILWSNKKSLFWKSSQLLLGVRLNFKRHSSFGYRTEIEETMYKQLQSNRGRNLVFSQILYGCIHLHKLFHSHAWRFQLSPLLFAHHFSLVIAFYLSTCSPDTRLETSLFELHFGHVSTQKISSCFLEGMFLPDFHCHLL